MKKIQIIILASYQIQISNNLDNMYQFPTPSQIVYMQCMYLLQHHITTSSWLAAQLREQLIRLVIYSRPSSMYILRY